MKKKLIDLFEKKPGEDMPNLLGWAMILVVNLATVALFLTVYATCQGCATSRITRHTPSGDVTIASTVTPFTSDYSEDFNSDADYQRCLTDRRTQRLTGGSWIWSDDQMTCYWQTATAGGATGFGGMNYGWAWSTPPLSITPGLR